MPAVVRALLPITDEAGEVVGDMPVTMSEQCATCKNWTHALRCRAYPGNIPEAILAGKHDHTTPFEGDGGILYDPIPTPPDPEPLGDDE